MPDIQVDMFEVQLGAAVLLQFKDSQGKSVSVIADGGIHAAGYPRDHVATKLKKLLPSQCIDVLIGTHYDQDHLAGLIEVADQFTIRDAILPPIRRPRHPKPGTSTAAVVSLLEAGGLEDASDLKLLIDLTDAEFEEHIAELEWLQAQAEERLRHAGGIQPLPPDVENEISAPDEEFDSDTGTAPSAPGNLSLLQAQLTRIRASAHTSAIVAKWLQKLVRKLQHKKVPIRAIDIAAGQPEYYQWDRGQLKFVSCTPAIYASSSEPKFALLGPSKALIAHHAKKLPIGVYLTINGQIPLKRVSASNQLSYVILFESAGQQILVCGDAGCVDFWNKKTNTYHPTLLQAIKNPHVVQIAHHAGDNHRFYDVLMQSGFASGAAPHSFLLLSHADGDTYRPSPAFDTFVQNLKAVRMNFELLSTSQPRASKVTGFKTLYHPAIQPPSNVGDVRLSFQSGAWTVDQHAVIP
jgi:hypothetical protein